MTPDKPKPHETQTAEDAEDAEEFVIE